MWDFYIVDYQPVQLYINLLKNRKLTYENKMEYKKILNAISQQLEIMKEFESDFSVK